MNAEIPGLGKVQILKGISPESVERVKTSPVLKQTQEIDDVLRPVVELIKESNLPDYDAAKAIFETRLDLSEG